MPVFTANVPGILKVGDKIEIGGKIKDNARKMSVNLCAQEGEEPRDVVLHFDVRFHRDNIISLSRKNGVWIGSGNYDTNYNMFVPGTIFRIVFEIKDTDVITIYCQGKFHSNFLPKIPLTMARFIVAWADVERITHCYFHMGQKGIGEDLSNPGPPPYGPTSPRPAAPPNIAGDAKRWASRSNVVEVRNITHRNQGGGTRSVIDSPRAHKKTSGSPQEAVSSNDSSDEEDTPGVGKSEGRADRFFYDTLMCQQTDGNFGSPERRRDLARCRAEYNRKYNRDMSDTEKNDSEEYSEEAASKNDSSVAESEDVLPDLKRNRRKFAPFAQVVSFMGKNGKRN
ncbi:uncharacterized protein LOC126378471 isoform X2 [Pectinophora gossypiella]|uniref:uncharacterized protein LOC126378471 isoform X2 n=1 Tax=Pectinophora gossypiella TaxID=13191 RepID=UPI00214F45B2|nr:uncharacterized protein LOC126378471 isoform X2 [Pectinophora gossypiella]